jgi:hypothetical protein
MTLLCAKGSSLMSKTLFVVAGVISSGGKVSMALEHLHGAATS